MIEPVKMADFFATFFSAASVIVFGALYALLFAYSRIKNVPRAMLLAYASYAALFVSVMVLATVAHLFATLFWLGVVVLMLAGYLAAPHAIWLLCVGTHDSAISSSRDERNPEQFHQSSKEKAS